MHYRAFMHFVVKIELILGTAMHCGVPSMNAFRSSLKTRLAVRWPIRFVEQRYD